LTHQKDKPGRMGGRGGGTTRKSPHSKTKTFSYCKCGGGDGKYTRRKQSYPACNWKGETLNRVKKDETKEETLSAKTIHANRETGHGHMEYGGGGRRTEGNKKFGGTGAMSIRESRSRPKRGGPVEKERKGCTTDK